MGLRKPIPKPETLAEMTADATATVSDILSGLTAYVKGQKLTGTASAGQSSITLTANGGGTSSSYINGFAIGKSKDYYGAYATSLTIALGNNIDITISCKAGGAGTCLFYMILA